MKKIFSACIGLVVLCLLLFKPISVQAEVMDNDGTTKQTPYGDSKLPNSFESCDYYDCYLPYKSTPRELGGYSTGVIDYVYDTYNYSMAEDYPELLDKPFTNQVNYYTTMNPYYQGRPVSVDEETKLQVITDNNGGRYYLTAVQGFFYNFGGLDLKDAQGNDIKFPDFETSNGQLFDVILTDGTVIHFCVADQNAIPHTNGGPMEESLWNVQLEFAPVNLQQYKNLYNAQAANLLELAGQYNSGCITKFKEKYNISEEGNQIAYYRMYNAKVGQAPARASNVGNEVSYKLDITGVVAQGSNSGDATGTSSAIVSEWELAGMPEKSKLTENQLDIKLPSKSDLSIGEGYSVSIIKDNIAIDNEATAFDKARIFIVFIGLILISYAMLLFVAMVFDRVNVFFDFSLVKILTFGKLDYCPYEKDLGNTVGKTNTSKLVISIIIVGIVGMFLVSGGILSIMSNIIYKFSQKFL